MAAIEIEKKQLYYVQQEFTSSWGGVVSQGAVIEILRSQCVDVVAVPDWVLRLVKGTIHGPHTTYHPAGQGREVYANTFGFFAREILDHCVLIQDPDEIPGLEMTRSEANELPAWLQ